MTSRIHDGRSDRDEDGSDLADQWRNANDALYHAMTTLREIIPIRHPSLLAGDYDALEEALVMTTKAWRLVDDCADGIAGHAYAAVHEIPKPS